MTPPEAANHQAAPNPEAALEESARARNPAPRRTPAERFGAFFAFDDPWVRPGPTRTQRRRDVLAAAGVFVLTVLGLELTRSMGAFAGIDTPLWAQYLAMVAGVIPLVWRRSHPLTSMVAVQLHMLAASLWWPTVGNQFTMLLAYLASLVSGVGWARNRRSLAGVLILLFVLLFGVLAWQYAFTSSITEYLPKDGAQPGLLPPLVASILYGFLMNLGYIVGGILWGQLSWRAAKRHAKLTEQAGTIATQATELRDRAVVDERLRIARELHDVVAHHVSVMGVQAAAARRVLSRDPQAAAQALSAVEESSRQAVGEMRSLLGTLRGVEVVRGDQPAGTHPPGPGTPPAAGTTHAGPTPGTPPTAGTTPGTPPTAGTPPLADPMRPRRGPDPGLAQLPELVAAAAAPGFDPTYELVEQSGGTADQVSAAVGMSIYRIVQEALSNVRKHSTARRAVVVVRVERDHVEAEIVDDGRPKGATSGTGLGLLGMRERIASHHGTVELGPRLVGGFRVRVRFPLHPGPAGTARTAPMDDTREFDVRRIG